MTDTYPRVSFRSYRRALMIHFVGGSADLLVRLDVRGVCLGSRSWTVNVHVTENARAIRLDGDLSAISIGNTDRQHDLIRLRLVVYSRATMRNDELLTRASEIVRYRSWLGELVWDRVRWIEKGLSKLELQPKGKFEIYLGSIWTHRYEMHRWKRIDINLDKRYDG